MGSNKYAFLFVVSISVRTFQFVELDPCSVFKNCSN